MKEIILPLITFFIAACWVDSFIENVKSKQISLINKYGTSKNSIDYEWLKQGQTTIDGDPKLRTCANVTRINLAVNLLDRECMKKSGNNASFMSEDKNSVEVQDIEMDMYAVCLLKKSSIMNEEGKINLNFDIVKIVQNLYKKTDEAGLGLAFIIKSLEKCRNLSGPNQYYTAAKIIKCLLDNQETILWCN